MSEKNYTHIAVVGDRSGSMSSIIDDAIGSFNTFLKEQKAVEGKATMTLALFDHEYAVVHEMSNIKYVKKMDNKTWVPRGTTALLDAIGKTINTVSGSIKEMKKDNRPERVLFVIITDGHENASREFSKPMISDLIKKKEAKSWEFIFLAADKEAIADAPSFGIKVDHAIFYNNTTKGVGATYSGLSNVTTKFRSVGTVDTTALQDLDKE